MIDTLAIINDNQKEADPDYTSIVSEICMKARPILYNQVRTMIYANTVHGGPNHDKWRSQRHIQNVFFFRLSVLDVTSLKRMLYNKLRIILLFR